MILKKLKKLDLEVKYVGRVVWNLNPDVNVLSGAIGTGKTLLLNAIKAKVIPNYDSFLFDSLDLNLLKQRAKFSKFKSKYQTKVFFDIIDKAFSETGKKIDRQVNDIQFFTKEGRLLPSYQLSKGEKRLLFILTTALLKSNKPTVLVFDDLCDSLHVDLKRQLIGDRKSVV